MQNFDDKDIMTDMLSSQKFMAQKYNHFAGECSTKQSKNKLMKILSEEHDIQFAIYEQMHEKGWYPTPEADCKKVNQSIEMHKKDATNLSK